MKQRKTKFASLILATALLFSASCAEDIDQNSIESVQNESSANKNAEFAKGLAMAVQDLEIRTFLQKEALKQVDKDYDVIYHLVKNDKLDNGTTFRESLAKYFDGVDNLDKITSMDPTLTILVPDISRKINAENWDIETQIPTVAFSKTNMSKEEDKLPSFNTKGEQSNIERYTKPLEMTLVVKSNERLSTPNNNLKNSILSNEKALKNNEGQTIGYFIDPEFNNTNTKQTRATSITYPKNIIHDDVHRFLNNKVYASYFHSYDSQRDYVYYNISKYLSVDKGTLDTNYREYIHSITFANDGVISHMSDYDDHSLSADWADGSFEIVLDFIFLTEESVTSKVTKMLSVSTKSLTKSDMGLTYNYLYPVEVFNWDLYRYGNAYKIVVSEYDPGIATERTENISSTYAHNWEISVGIETGIWKIGAKYGGSYTKTKQSSTKINFTNNSDPLGETITDFFNPINKVTELKFHFMNVSSDGYVYSVVTETFKYYELDKLKAWHAECIKTATRESKYNYKFLLGTKSANYYSNTGMVLLNIAPMSVYD